MKFLLFILVLMLLSGCATTFAVSEKSTSYPTWFLNLPLKKYEVIGYGSARTLEEAKTIARADISKSVTVTVESKFSMNKMIVQKNQDFNQSTVTESNINEHSKILLSDVNVIKSEKVDNTFFVAMSYINLSFIEKILKEVRNKNLSPLSKNSLFRYSYFSRLLLAELNYIPSYRLLFKDAKFYVNIAHKLYLLQYSDLKFFFVEKYSEDIELVASSRYLKVHDYFHFSLKSRKSGYLSLFQVDEEGKIIVHINNKKVSKNTSLVYPDLNLYNGLEAGIIDMRENIQENYIAVLCKNRINTSSYEKISYEYNANAQSLRYPSLDRTINSCEYSAIILHTKGAM